MKPVSESTRGAWERTLTRYFAAHGVPLSWDGWHKRFVGVAGHAFSRMNPRSEEGVWTRMPEYVKKYEKLTDKQVVVFVTNRQYGDSVDDSLVVMRMGTFTPMLKALVDGDRERWVE